MLINISKPNAVSIMERYFEDIKHRNYYLNDSDKNISEYISSQPQNYINLVERYIHYIDEVFNRIDDIKFKSPNNYWKCVLVEDGIFFDNIFTIEDIIFIKKSKLLEIYTMFDLNNDFIIELVNARLNTLFYINFGLWKEYIENNNSYKIMDIINYKLEYNFEIYKNIEYSFMDKFFVIYENQYVFVDKVVDTIVKFCPYYDKKIFRIEIQDNTIKLHEEENNDYFNINPFDKIKRRFISNYF